MMKILTFVWKYRFMEISFYGNGTVVVHVAISNYINHALPNALHFCSLFTCFVYTFYSWLLFGDRFPKTFSNFFQRFVINLPLPRRLCMWLAKCLLDIGLATSFVGHIQLKMPTVLAKTFGQFLTSTSDKLFCKILIICFISNFTSCCVCFFHHCTGFFWKMVNCGCWNLKQNWYDLAFHSCLFF